LSLLFWVAVFFGSAGVPTMSFAITKARQTKASAGSTVAEVRGNFRQGHTTTSRPSAAKDLDVTKQVKTVVAFAYNKGNSQWWSASPAPEVRRAPLNKWHFLTLSADLKALCASA
jgi:hypothetical protein